MNPGDSQIVERLGWEGAVSAPVAVAILLALAVWTAWSLWRERFAVGRGWAAVFWVLRMMAFGCALWMLAGPTQLRIERMTQPQSIAIYADGSESMDVVDAPDPTDSIRWALAVSDEQAESAVRDCDRLLVDLGAAHAACVKLDEAVKQHRPLKQLKMATAAVAGVLRRATDHAAAMAATLAKEDDDLGERAERIETLLKGPAAESLAAVEAAFDGAKGNYGEDLAVRIEQCAEAIATARRRAAVLTAELAEVQAAATASERSEADGMTRRQKVSHTLDAFEKQIAGELSDGVRIRRFRFDDRPTAVDGTDGWAKALSGAAPRAADDLQVEADDESEEQAAVVGPSTNLSSVLEQLASEGERNATRLAVVLTDGRHNSPDVRVPQEVATQLNGMAVYLVPIGSAVRMRDVLLHRVEAPATVAEKDSALIDVIVSGFDCEGETSVVVLRHEGREVDRKEIAFAGAQGDQRARFKVPADKLGWQEYVVEVEPISDEVNTANNFMPVSFEVVRDETRVLLAHGVAHWEYRYLNQLFRREQHIEFDELAFAPRVHGSGALAERPEFPQDVEGWSRYDVVILGDVGPLQISEASQQALVETGRKRGCNVIQSAGENSLPDRFVGQPLMELLPVERDANVFAREGYELKVSDEGRFHSALLIAGSMEESARVWEQIYERFPVYALSDYSRPKDTARTLLSAVSDAAGDVTAEDNGKAEHAFLCWQRVGAGRVVYLAAPETYRLRWRGTDEMHHRFWGQLLRWITATNAGAGSDLVRLQTDRTSYLTGESVEVTAWLKDANGRPLAGETVAAQAMSFDKEASSVELTADEEVPGRYFGKLDRLPAGAYQVTVEGAIVDKLMPAGTDQTVMSTITVRSGDSIEMMNTQCNRALLDQVAKITGGQVIPPTAIDEVLRLVSFTPEVNERIERTPLWNRWSNLWLVLGCVFLEWMVRKGKGLV
jgi:hypothetical protein